MELPLNARIEAVLFFEGGPLPIKKIATALSVSEGDIDAALPILGTALQGRGITLTREGDMVGLVTAPGASEIIENIRREELEGPLGKAGLETLAIIIYRGPLSKTDIEYIRGVNCGAVLRTLTIRGLVERTAHPTDKRSVVYRATIALPAALGVSTLNELPDYDMVREELARIIKEKPEQPPAS